MKTRFEEIKEQSQALSSKEKAALARILIEELDASVDQNVEQLWIEEAQRRYDDFIAGKIESSAGEEAMQRARQRLK